MSNKAKAWTDEEIIAESEAISAYFDSYEIGKEVQALCFKIRDSLQARIVQLETELAEFEGEL